LIGWDDIKDCLTQGAFGACVRTVINFIPWGKILKAGEIIADFWKGAKALITFGKEVEKAEKVIVDTQKVLADAERAADAAVDAERAASKVAHGAEEAKGAEAAESSADNVLEGCNSFRPGTLVTLADGSAKPIEQVRLGDRVLAADPATGNTVAEAVVATIVGRGLKQLVELTYETQESSGGAKADVVATDGHPFWLPEERRWVTAGELRPGDSLQTSTGTLVKVVGARHRSAIQQVHNLTVDALHTYFVQAAGTSVLVHNNSCSSNARILGNNMENAGVARPADSAAHHIVASTSPQAAPARSQLGKFGIDINHHDNGVFLPRRSSAANPTGASVHSKIHTRAYFAYVNEMMSGARNASEARDVLGYIRNQLLAGAWP
jgi:hypothetical protein